MGARFNQEKFNEWEQETHIPQDVMNMLNFICEKIGVGEVVEETISLRSRFDVEIGYAKGFTISYCTSSLADGPSIDYSDVLLKFIKGLGFHIENSYGDNGMDWSTNWHDTFWYYDFVYKPSEVFDTFEELEDEE